jgi:hypothetical protein
VLAMYPEYMLNLCIHRITSLLVYSSTINLLPDDM